MYEKRNSTSGTSGSITQSPKCPCTISFLITSNSNNWPKTNAALSFMVIRLQFAGVSLCWMEAGAQDLTFVFQQGVCLLQWDNVVPVGCLSWNLGFGTILDLGSSTLITLSFPKSRVSVCIPHTFSVSVVFIYWVCVFGWSSLLSWLPKKSVRYGDGISELVCMLCNQLLQ